MKAAKVIGGLLLTVVFLLFFVAKFSSVPTRFECIGEMSADGRSQPATLYFKLEEYRWWVHLWGNSDGAVFTEFPDKTVEFYSHIERLGDDVFAIYQNETIKGRFSRLSHRLDLATTAGSFEGKCSKID
jgi:hypothetical protein